MPKAGSPGRPCLRQRASSLMLWWDAGHPHRGLRDCPGNEIAGLWSPSDGLADPCLEGGRLACGSSGGCAAQAPTREGHQSPVATSRTPPGPRANAEVHHRALFLARISSNRTGWPPGTSPARSGVDKGRGWTPARLPRFGACAPLSEWVQAREDPLKVGPNQPDPPTHGFRRSAVPQRPSFGVLLFAVDLSRLVRRSPGEPCRKSPLLNQMVFARPGPGSVPERLV